MNERIGNTEIGYNDDGTVDEILVCDSKGKCLVHIEQMDKGHFWMGIEGKDDDETVHANFLSRGKITLTVTKE